MGAKTWTDERTELLKTLWMSGRTGTEIGDELGVTRSAVLGKINRLGMIGRKEVSIKSTKPPKPLPSQVERDGKPLRDAMPNDCRYMVSTTDICGEAQMKGSKISMCERHHVRCHRPIKTKEETDKDINENRQGNKGSIF